MAANAEVASTRVTMVESINRAIADAMADDDTVVVLGEDVADPEDGGICGVTKGLSTRFGDHRVRSTPIAEQAIVGAAIGASLVGFRPIAEIMLMNFTTVAMDMIVNHAAKLRFMSGGQTHVPITIRTMTGAGFASGGQHSDYLEAWFAHTAGIKVVAPSNPADAYGLMRSCIDDPDPCLFIENLPTYWSEGEMAASGSRVPLGRASIAVPGSDLTVVSYARSLTFAVEAAKTLSQEGISAEVVDLRTISPWDRETVFGSVGKTGRLLVVHEAVQQFGVGAEIVAETDLELFGKLHCASRRLGGAYCAVPYSQPLEEAFAPNAERIAAMARAMVRG